MPHNWALDFALVAASLGVFGMGFLPMLVAYYEFKQ